MTASNVTQLCTFYLGDLFCGVEASVVREIVRSQRMTRVPKAPPEIAGLINLRGQIIVALDLRVRIGLESACPQSFSMNVVVKVRDEVVSLLVDRIGDIVEVNDRCFEPPPVTLRGVKRTVIEGAYKINGQLLATLNHNELVNADSFASAGSTQAHSSSTSLSSRGVSPPSLLPQ